MNNILFCSSLVTEGSLSEISNGELAFYNNDTLEITTNVAGKDFGIINATIAHLSINAPSVVNIPDIHLLKAVSATLPGNISYNITLGLAETEEEEEPDTSDVEVLIIHRNVAPNGEWRHFITIPYSEFNGDGDNLLDALHDKIKALADGGHLDGVTVSDVNTSAFSMYCSNTEQYVVSSKSPLLKIEAPSGYKPLTAPAKLFELIDKNCASLGIWHREEDDDWYKHISSLINENQNFSYDSIISLRYVSPRKASVTHDETLYKTLHIFTTSEVSETLMSVIDGSYTPVEEPAEQNPSN